MLRTIEQELQKIPSRLIEHASISSILSNLGYSRINDKILQLMKHKILMPIKKGLYVYVPLRTERLLQTEILANAILSPSYISLDYALSYYNAIPERVDEITSITTKRAKTFHTPYGIFSFKHIKKDLFNIGLHIQHSQNLTYLIATKEKALCDKVFFTKNIELRNKKDIVEFLENDIRVDLDEFIDADLEIFKHYFYVSKSHKIKILTKIIQGLKK